MDLELVNKSHVQTQTNNVLVHIYSIYIHTHTHSIVYVFGQKWSSVTQMNKIYQALIHIIFVGGSIGCWLVSAHEIC